MEVKTEDEKTMEEVSKFAIVKLSAAEDVVKLLQLLVNHGYVEVSFVRDLNDGTCLPWSVAQPVGLSDPNHFNDKREHSSDYSTDSGTVIPNSGSNSENKSNSPEVDSSNSETEVVHHPMSVIKTNHVTIPKQLNGFEGSSDHPGSVGSISYQHAFPMPLLSHVQSLMLSGPSLKSTHPGNHLDRPSHQFPAIATSPSLFPSSTAGSSCLAGLTTPATTQLRQRGSRAQTDDPSAYVSCKLCHNRIMATRLSNLTNHVRRHSTLKQFQCCYCDYTHNEMAKVRLHMLHNHKDKDSQPIDNLSPEMQAAWDLLMHKCFPDHYTGPLSSEPPVSDKQSLTPQPSIDGFDHCRIMSHLMAGGMRTCQDCMITVPSAARVQHIREVHIKHKAFVCSACGFEDNNQWHVLTHLQVKHNHPANPAKERPQVFTRDMDSVVEALLPKYFPVPLPLASLPPMIEHPAIENIASDSTDDSEKTSVSTTLTDDETQILPSNLDKQIIPGTENLRCLQCLKVLEGVRPLSSLLSHAKRHYHIKQYQCPACAYSSCEAVHVRNHIRLKHDLPNLQPVDNRSPALQVAWMQTMIRCFPAVAPRLNKFRFKNFRSKPTGRPAGKKKRHQIEQPCSLRQERPHKLCSQQSEDSSSDTQMENDEQKKCRPSIHGNDESHIEPPREGSNCSSESAGNRNSSNSSGSDDGCEHLGSKKQCRLCGKWISNERQFIHATTHIPIKPFGCSICEFRSSDYQQLRAHMWKHKLIGVEKQKARITTCDVAALRSEYVKFCFESN